MKSNEGYITIKDINFKYMITKNKKSKRITFRFYDDILHISAPYLTSYNYILNTVNQLNNEIYNLVAKSKKKEISFNCFDDITFFGKEYMIVYGTKDKIEENKIYLNKDDPKKSYFNLVKKYGLKILQERVDYYLHVIEPKLELKELKIRNMVSRYGDCYPTRKTITLNTKLAYYSLEEIDSVIVHELIHLIYPNHSAAFYQKVLEYCPSYYTLKKKMDEVSLR